jgi:hypothetical protein
MRMYEALLPVTIEAIALFLLSRLLFTEVVSSFADRRGKGFLLAVLRLPGNTVHELSHALGFVVCGYRVKRLLLCIFDRQGRGSCTPGRPWSPLAFPQLAIGLAALLPLLIGSTVLVFAARALGVLPTDLPPAPAGLLPVVWQQALELVGHLDWHQWQTWLFLYLALSIGAELSPSATDLRYGVPTLLALAALAWLGFFGLHHARHLRLWEHRAEVAALAGLVRLGTVLGLALIVSTTAAVVTLLPALLVRVLRRH